MFSLIRLYVWLCVMFMATGAVTGPGIFTWLLWEMANQEANNFSHGWSYLSGFATITGLLYYGFYLFNPVYKAVNYKISAIGSRYQ